MPDPEFRGGGSRSDPPPTVGGDPDPDLSLPTEDELRFEEEEFGPPPESDFAPDEPSPPPGGEQDRLAAPGSREGRAPESVDTRGETGGPSEAPRPPRDDRGRGGGARGPDLDLPPSAGQAPPPEDDGPPRRDDTLLPPGQRDGFDGAPGGGADQDLPPGVADAGPSSERLQEVRAAVLAEFPGAEGVSITETQFGFEVDVRRDGGLLDLFAIPTGESSFNFVEGDLADIQVEDTDDAGGVLGPDDPIVRQRLIRTRSQLREEFPFLDSEDYEFVITDAGTVQVELTDSGREAFIDENLGPGGVPDALAPSEVGLGFRSAAAETAAEQGVEAGAGDIAEQARQFEQQVIEQVERIDDPSEVSIGLEGTTFSAGFTPTGREAFRSELAADIDEFFGDLQQEANAIVAQTLGLGTERVREAEPPVTTFDRELLSAERREEARSEIVGELESQLEEQTGVDLDPGEDFRTIVEGERVTAELTDEGRRKVAGDEFEDEVTGLPVPTVFATIFEPMITGEGSEVEPSEVPGFSTLEFGDLPTVDEEDASLEDVLIGTQATIFGGAEAIAESIGGFAPLIAIERLRGELEEAEREGEIDIADSLEDVVFGREAEGPVERRGEAFAQGALELPAAPLAVIGALEEAREGGLEAGEIARGESEFEPEEADRDGGGRTGPGAAGEFAATETAAFGVSVFENIGTQLSTPEGRFRFAGSIAGSLGLMTGAAALSRSLGLASRLAIQPGEELASVGLSRAFPRVASRFPRGRIDNEEIILQQFVRAGRRTAEAGRRAKALARAEESLRPSPRQAELIERFRFGGGAEFELAEEFRPSAEAEGGEVVGEAFRVTAEGTAGARSEPLGSPTESILDAIESAGELEEGGVPAAELFDNTVDPFSEFRKFLAEERAQLELVPRGEVEEPEVSAEFEEREDLLAGGPRDLMSTEVAERNLADVRAAEGEFEGIPDPLGEETRGFVEATRGGAVESEVEGEMEDTALARRRAAELNQFAEVADEEAVAALAAMAPDLLGDRGLDPLSDLGADTGLDFEQFLDLELELELEEELGVESETDVMLEALAEMEAALEAETEFESEFEAEPGTEIEAEAETLPDPFEPREDEEEFPGFVDWLDLFENPVATGPELFGIPDDDFWL